jgi:formylglycine-generating enzyme required for sulfatase activity
VLRSLVVVSLLLCGCELAVNLAHFDDGCRPGRGPTAVRVAASSSSGHFCIDSTEVTRGDYQDFLSAVASSPSSPSSVAALPAGCEGVNDFTPKKDWPPAPGTETYPVSQVDWCSASAYCAWAGKRLCGRIGGGAVAVGNPEHDPAQSEWFDACTRGGTRAYPYGAAYDANACTGDVASVGSRAACVGGYDGLHDMSGNVWEWTNTCDSTDPGSFCHASGGAFDSTPDELACAATPRPWTRTSGAANIGIRCCQDR